ncbi:MAG: glycosyltransferase, partial [Candidatus Tectomicrobia bacterium]|nr:glycosyltransferase [Candidatus Tectomicrobia bacterium]
RRVGHRGKVVLTSGNSKETIPEFLQQQPELFFDLVTVDGDHSAEGARIDLQHVLLRVKVGGVLVFDDICHPLHPWLERVWDEVVGTNSNFVSEKYKDVGHGVAFAIRRGIDAEVDSVSGDALEKFKQVSMQLEETKVERDELRSTLAELRQQFEFAEADRAARLKVIEEQGHRLSEIDAERHHLQAELARWAMIQPVLQRLRASRPYRLMCGLGRWDWLDQALSIVLSSGSIAYTATKKASERHRTVAHFNRQLRRIAVDLTPVLPGGENGGAKLLALSLVKSLSQIAPECEFVLLTSDKSHGELETLDSHNVRRLCVAKQDNLPSGRADEATRSRSWLRDWLISILPPRIINGLKSVEKAMFHKPRQSSLPKTIGADLVFCPFTAPFFFDPTVPIVIVVYDLQYLYYPQFFTVNDRYQRDKHFRESCRLATKLICISEYVRGTVLQNTGVAPERVSAIHIRLFHRLEKMPPEKVTQVLTRFGLCEGRFLLYPANFWAHKNHEMLFTAFGIYCARHPASNLKLVCTGAPDARMDFLRHAVSGMNLEESVVFPGYVPDEDFSGLLQSCQAVIFPSLYEGFGMPLLEAMTFGKPVLCSNITSLPEIAGDAALFFDPRNPQEIVSAIERIESDSDLAADLIRKGYERLNAFGDTTEMARQYLQVFHEALPVFCNGGTEPQWH